MIRFFDLLQKQRRVILTAFLVLMGLGLAFGRQLPAGILPDVIFPRITVIAESGELPGEELIARLAALAPAPIPAAAARAAWLDMFELDHAMIGLAHALAARHRVYLLSNIGDLHWMHLAREFGLHRIGHGALPSFLAGSMKPAAPIYAEAERRFALEPRRTVFIDDRHDNIAAARERGWHGIVHADYASTRAALALVGVELDAAPGEQAG
jgi:putative hydrolase of the HAD superfamily